MDLQALVKSIVQDRAQISPLKPQKLKIQPKQEVDHPFSSAPEPTPVFPMSQKQSSSGTEGTHTLNEAGRTATSANIQKSTTGKSTSSSGANKEMNYMTIKDIPIDLKNLDVAAKRQSKDTNCTRMSQKVYPGDQLLNKRIVMEESDDRVQSMDQSSLSSYQNIESSSQGKTDTGDAHTHKAEGKHMVRQRISEPSAKQKAFGSYLVGTSSSNEPEDSA